MELTGRQSTGSQIACLHRLPTLDPACQGTPPLGVSEGVCDHQWRGDRLLGRSRLPGGSVEYTNHLYRYFMRSWMGRGCAGRLHEVSRLCFVLFCSTATSCALD